MEIADRNRAERKPHRKRFRPLPAVVFGGFIIYITFLALHMGAYAGQADSSGYLNQARLLSEGQVHTPQRTLASTTGGDFSDFLFVPLGFRPAEAGTMTPTYPIGLPLMLAAAAKLVGWEAAPHFTMAVCALLGLVLTALLAREIGLPWGWAWCGAFTLGASPLYTFMSLQLLSDVPATAAATAALICAWRSRHHPGWAVAAGVMTAAAVLIRPSNVLLGLPVLICLGRNWRCWGWCALGCLPGAAAQLLYNSHAYGKGLESGYGDIFALFSWRHVPATLTHYGNWLWITATPVSLALLVLLWTGRRATPLAWAMVVWVLSVSGFYVGYKHTADAWWALRFLLPVFPAAIVGGLYVVHRWWERRQQVRPVSNMLERRLAAGATLFLVLHEVGWGNHLGANRIGAYEGRYAAASRWLQAQLPPDAVLAAMQCSGALHYYTDFTVVRYDTITPGQFAQIVQLCHAAHRPIYAVLWPSDVPDFDAASSGTGNWIEVAKIETVSVRIPSDTLSSSIDANSHRLPATAK